jgi:hypothetical protein
MKLTKMCASLSLALGLIAAPQARADNWGCEVLLCLSNPAGPMAVAQCVPPITRLYRAIFKWRPDPFPTCTMVNGGDAATTGNFAYVAPATYYDACPEGTTAVASGTYAAGGRQSNPSDRNPFSWWLPTPPYILTTGIVTGIGDGSGYFPSTDNPMPAKICAGNYLGQTQSTTGTSSDDYTTINVNIYDRVVVVDPASDSFAINVHVSGQLYRVIRPFSRSTVRELTM